MSSAEHEFILLKKRFKKAVEYEKTDYITDPPEKCKAAEAIFNKLLKRISDVWNELTDIEKNHHRDIFKM